MSTAAVPLGGRGRSKTARRAAGWLGGGPLALLLLLLLLAVVTAPRPELCGPTAATGDGGGGVTAEVSVSRGYPRPVSFGAYRMTPGQLVFSDVLAKRVGWDVWVIRAQVLNEMSGAAAQGRERANNNNWLNVGYFDALGGDGAFQGKPVWRNPVTAGNATADWIQGKRETIDSKAADSIRTAYRRGKDVPASEAIALLQGSGWATSRYPQLPGIYAGLTAGGRGSTGTPEGSPVLAGLGCPTNAAAVGSAGDVTAAVTPWMGKDWSGALAAGMKPLGWGAGTPWCQIFVQNVLAKLGIDRPTPNTAHSSNAYTWATTNKWGTLLHGPGKPASSSLQLQPGDIVMYGSPGAASSHVNMVEKVDERGVVVVGGNQGCPGGANCVSRRGPVRLVGSGGSLRWSSADSRPIWAIVRPPAPKGAAA